jgi:hypothetical protein
MISPSIRDEVLRELEKLGAADQQRVMDFLRALGKLCTGAPAERL